MIKIGTYTDARDRPTVEEASINRVSGLGIAGNLDVSDTAVQPPL